MKFQELKNKQRQIRSGFSENLALRVHRALSWLDKSEQCADDKDSQFVFLWIAIQKYIRTFHNNTINIAEIILIIHNSINSKS